MSFVEAMIVGDVSREISAIAQELAKESTRNLPKKAYASRVKKQRRVSDSIKKDFQKSFDQYYERIKRSLELLAFRGLLRRLNPERLVSMLSSNNDQDSVQDRIGLSDEDILSFYEYGAEFFNNKEYQEASDIFLLLTLLNPLAASFWGGLGMAEEKKEDFDAAALSFLMAAEVGEENNNWLEKARECFLAVGKKAQADALFEGRKDI